jgi:fructose-1,6-bisphosphatase/inositol monophosphatase family enzyme
MSGPDIATVGALLREAAARHILPRFRALADGDIQQKSPGDVVTQADIDAQAFLVAAFRKLTPDAFILGEEDSGSADQWRPRLVDAEESWLIDPVDGTHMFARGIPLFGVMVSYQRRGETVKAWILDPVADELVTAERGSGAWEEGRRLQIAPVTANLKSVAGSMNLSLAPREYAIYLAGQLQQLGPIVELRCAAHNYKLLAEGRHDFTLTHRLYPWDHAPGQLIHREAGGYAARLDGSGVWKPADDPWAGPVLTAPDPVTWERLRAVLTTP